MSMAIATIASNIADIDIGGVDIRGLDEIPDSFTARDCPALCPEPVNFVTDFVVERDSYGSPSQSKKTARYTLNYTLFYMPVGASRYGLDRYGDMVEIAFAVLDAIIATDDLGGTVEFTPQDTINFGVVLDATGNSFQGCRILLRVTEFIN